jgi:hypothetical protein
MDESCAHMQNGLGTNATSRAPKTIDGLSARRLANLWVQGLFLSLHKQGSQILGS